MSTLQKYQAIAIRHKHSVDEDNMPLFMIATNGFNTGLIANDVPNIVIFGWARSMIECWQATRRIGRDNQPGAGHILYHENHMECGGEPP